MVDLITLTVLLLVILAVFLRRTSAGVAILALMAGVLLDQLIAGWLIDLLPDATVDPSFTAAAVHIVLTFAPMVAALVGVKTAKQNRALSLVASLALSFLVLFFGVKIINDIGYLVIGARTYDFLQRVLPYQNVVLAGAALLATVEMVVSQRGKGKFGKKDSKK